MMGPPELKPAVRRIPSIKLNNQPPRVLYESIGKIAGITTVIDPDGLGAVQTRNFNVEMGEATVDQAFDYVALLTHTYWKAISPTTIFVTQDTANKRRDYEDFVVKTFYITNASTVQEFQEISTAVRTITNITRVFTVNPQKALVVRGSADAVALAEKLVHDLDKPKSEVVIDVLIMEANTTHTRDLAASLASVGASGLSAGLSSAINFTPRGSTTTDSGTGTGAAATPSSRLHQPGAARPHLFLRFFDHAAGRAAASRAERQQDEDPELAAGARIRRHEGFAQDRRPDSDRYRQLPIGRGHGGRRTVCANPVSIHGRRHQGGDYAASALQRRSHAARQASKYRVSGVIPTSAACSSRSSDKPRPKPTSGCARARSTFWRVWTACRIRAWSTASPGW